MYRNMHEKLVKIGEPMANINLEYRDNLII
nr:MAG TPA: hypothetical protein [Caudoviricetes sp.]